MTLRTDFLQRLTYTLDEAPEDATVIVAARDLQGAITHTQSVRPAELVALCRTVLETAVDMLDRATTPADIQALRDALAALEYLPDRDLEDDEGDEGGQC
jgi:hypothetical protein